MIVLDSSLIPIYFYLNIYSTFTDDRINNFLVVSQFYQSEVNNEYVIRGNAAVLRCSIPSFVADFVNVISWHDEAGNEYPPKNEQNSPNYGSK